MNESILVTQIILPLRLSHKEVVWRRRNHPPFALMVLQGLQQGGIDLHVGT